MDRLEVSLKEKQYGQFKKKCEIAQNVGYPVLVRPILCTRLKGMEICYDEENLIKYLSNAFEKDSENPVLLDNLFEWYRS